MNERVSNIGQKWCVPDTDEILWADWDNNFVAFHRPSGRTHLLNEASHKLLTKILLEPKTAANIAGELTEGADEIAMDQVESELEKLLVHLEVLGLVRRA